MSDQLTKKERKAYIVALLMCISTLTMFILFFAMLIEYNEHCLPQETDMAPNIIRVK